MNVLFKTIHGSHLYGLAHEDSDDDFYVVVDKVRTKKKKFAKQTIVDGIDTTIVDLGTWLHLCEVGVPQALEAMFSRKAEIDHIGALRAQYCTATSTWDRYLRTIKSFAMEGDFKHKRHALRLALNLRTMARTGRFNPTLNAAQVGLVSLWAEHDEETVYEICKNLVWEETHYDMA